ncbi:MAG: metallophosphoesterase [Synergistaceae bacterium]|jgi:predicted phosphodiesterase|nr:metallophosphoesterase [Synergistaceae bacterium]
MSLGMKPRPGRTEGLWRKFRDFFSAGSGRSFDLLLDKLLVRAGWVPEMMDGSGRILHISDTPTCMYGYLARLLRRVNPSVVVHTGDLADDIKLEIYPGEAERYRAAARRIMDILLAPRRKIIISLGNHDKRALLPSLPSQCVICDNDDVMDITLYGEKFRVSHYFESILGKPARYNLFGHSMETPSFSDGEERCFFNGLEKMRLIGPKDAGITIFSYPKSANDARLARRNRKGP